VLPYKHKREFMPFSKNNIGRIWVIFSIFILSACGGSSTETQKLPPIAKAGENIQIDELLKVSLLGAGHSPDGANLTYLWEQTAGVSVELMGATTLEPTFFAPDIQTNQVLTFRLTVTDSRALSSNDSVDVNVRALFKVMTSTPADLTSDVDRIKPLVLTFNDPIDAASVESAITLATESGLNWRIDKVNVNGKTLEVYPTQKLFGDTKYLLTIDEIVKSKDGVSLDDHFVVGFTTTLGQWQDPIYFWEDGGDSSTSISDNGDIVSVHWSYNQIISQYEIYMVERRAGEWSSPRKISTTPSVYSPDVAMSNNGDVIITWENWGDEKQTFVLEYVDGEWKSPWTFAGARYPNTTAVNDDGYAVVASLLNSGNGDDRIVVMERNGSLWNETNIAVLRGVRSLSMATSDNGSAIVVWTQERPTGQEYKIFASIRSDDKWREPTQINGEVYQISGIDAAISDEGNALVVWSRSNEKNAVGTWQALRNEFLDGQWIGEVAFDEISKQSVRPRVEMSNNGETSLVWEQGAFGTDNPIAISNKIAGNWSLPTVVGEGQYSDVVIAGNGERVIVWDIRDAFERRIGLARCKEGTCNSNPTFAASENKHNVMWQEIAINYSGDVSLVWDGVKSGNWHQFQSVIE
jgi:hypothetical protein